MVSVRPISELTTAPEGCFAFVGPCSSLSLKFTYPGGIGENNDFEAFSHESGTIIRFEQIPQTEQSSWSMTAVLDTGEEYLLHRPVYEEHFDFWENKPLRAHEFLGFLDSVELGFDPNKPVLTDSRCDNGMFGPRMYDPKDGIKDTPIDFSLLGQTVGSKFDSLPMLSINGVAHINAQYVEGIDMSWRNWPAVTLTARTLSGMLRQLCEWRELYLLGIATENYAQDACLFIDGLGITEDMIQELKEAEVPMPTERFMRGYGNPRHGFSEKGNLPESLKNHLKKQLFYKDLSVLQSQHPLHPEINASLKSEEKAIHHKNILMFSARRMPHIPIDEITTEIIYDCFYIRGQFSGTGMMPPIKEELPLMFAARNGARFFDATS